MLEMSLNICDKFSKIAFVLAFRTVCSSIKATKGDIW